MELRELACPAGLVEDSPLKAWGWLRGEVLCEGLPSLLASGLHHDDAAYDDFGDPGVPWGRGNGGVSSVPSLAPRVYDQLGPSQHWPLNF